MDVALTRGLLAVASTDLFCKVIFLPGGNALNLGSSIRQARMGIPMPKPAPTHKSWHSWTDRMTGGQSGIWLAGSEEYRLPAGCHLWRESPYDLRTGDPQTEGIPAGDAGAAGCDSIHGHRSREIGNLTTDFFRAASCGILSSRGGLHCGHFISSRTLRYAAGRRKSHDQPTTSK